MKVPVDINEDDTDIKILAPEKGIERGYINPK